MKPSPQHARPGKSTAAQAKQTSLQRTLTSALNDLGVEAALVAVFGKEDGPLDLQLFRGFTAREAQAILRSLSAPDLELRHVSPDNGETGKAVRLRLITPSAKSSPSVPTPGPAGSFRSTRRRCSGDRSRPAATRPTA